MINVELNEAINIMSKMHPKLKLVSVVDYDNYFVFSAHPTDYDRDTNGEYLGGLIAVDKLFKVTMHFIPLLHNPSEYAKAAKNNVTYF